MRSRFAQRVRTIAQAFAEDAKTSRAGRLHEEITADYNDMIYAATREEVETRLEIAQQIPATFQTAPMDQPGGRQG